MMNSDIAVIYAPGTVKAVWALLRAINDGVQIRILPFKLLIGETQSLIHSIWGHKYKAS